MTDTLDRLRDALADKYTIEREPGAGGIATVYLAHDLRGSERDCPRQRREGGLLRADEVNGWLARRDTR